MRTFDFSPLYRTSVGFDRLPSLLDAINQRDSNTSGYPHYNIELVEDDRYRISMAVAGFAQEELSIQTEKQTLTIKGVKSENQDERSYLHQGIASRNFERKFQLAEHVEVSGAKLENGLLHVDLVREIPQAARPRTIAIDTGDTVELESPKLNSVNNVKVA